MTFEVKLFLVITMDKKRKRRSSGPRSFDRDQAVETAMHLFRRYGYEGVSIADLTTAIGIAPPSLYSAFGSKAGLYREALDLYEGLPGAIDGMKGSKSLEQALAGLFHAAIRVVTADERGCMISTGLVEGAIEQQELVRELGDRRRALRDNIANALCQWVNRPEAERLAAYVSVIQQGMSVQARDGTTAEELSRIAEDAVAGILLRCSKAAS